MKEIRIFKLENGKRPLSNWLLKLDRSFRSRVLDRFEKLEEGHYGDFKIIDKEIKELRFKFGAGYRVYFHENNNTIMGISRRKAKILKKQKTT